MKIRVLIVDDSPAYRALLKQILEEGTDIEVVAEAESASSALEKAVASAPDVVTMDIVMPGGGVEATRAIMRARPVPIMVVTAPLVQEQSTLPFQAMAAGALEVFLKPTQLTGAGGAQKAEQLRERVRALARRGKPVRTEVHRPPPARARRPECRLVILAASTGGPAAVKQVLSGLESRVKASVLVVQHIGKEFEDGLIEWWAEHSPLPVSLARDGERLEPGSVLVAPSGTHLRLRDKSYIACGHGAKVHGCRPSADVTMESAALQLAAACAGVVLTGMGSDGAQGLLAIRRAGGWTAAQDAATSVIYGMPREAERLGAADFVLPLDQIAPRLMELIGGVT